MLARSIAVGALPALAWTVFSLYYYGFPVPNTVYAKLGAGVPFGERIVQGGRYLLDSLGRDFVTLPAIVIGVALALRASLIEMALTGGSLLYIASVVSAGGDFMSGRFLTAPLVAAAIAIARSELTTRQVKVAAVQSYGGIVDLVNVREVSRARRVEQLLAEHTGAFPAPAYDDYRVVAGNSTLGKEILSGSDFDVIVVPVGGGGLSSGIVIARDYLHARAEIIGAEPLPGNDAARSLRAGQLLSNEHEPATVADGARTLSLGQLNWEILQHGVKDIIEVPDALTLDALRRYFTYVNLKVEPTGALALGALLAQPEQFSGKRVCCIVSGGNVDPAVYAQALLAQPTELR